MKRQCFVPRLTSFTGVFYCIDESNRDHIDMIILILHDAYI